MSDYGSDLDRRAARNDQVDVPRSYYVVSDVWNGRLHYIGTSAKDVCRMAYHERLSREGYDTDTDQTEVSPEQFRAWPMESWPHGHMSFEEIFKWIGEQE